MGEPWSSGARTGGAPRRGGRPRFATATFEIACHGCGNGWRFGASRGQCSQGPFPPQHSSPIRSPTSTLTPSGKSPSAARARSQARWHHEAFHDPRLPAHVHLARQVAGEIVTRSITGHVTQAMTEHYSHVGRREKLAAAGSVVRLVFAGRNPPSGGSGGGSTKVADPSHARVSRNPS